ncbi:hypothetical protein NE237_019569 [Protea cynaroides]|uniref:Uncharacterized protein n=1 Tax=Protea cynaroides TaxID=273540 RepID=A0A9Q0K0U1_9MAGN|nr:hypothetical protein NE237_019569 [Protea cynaroides]
MKAIIEGPTTGNTSMNSQNTYTNSMCSTSTSSTLYGTGDLIPFFDEDLLNVDLPHDDAMIITMVIDKTNKVKRVLVNTGSSGNILYYQTFKAMNINEKCIRSIAFALISFSGDTIKVKEGTQLKT